MSNRTQNQTPSATYTSYNSQDPRILRLRADYEVHRSVPSESSSSAFHASPLPGRRLGSSDEDDVQAVGPTSITSDNENEYHPDSDQIDPSLCPHPRVPGVITPAWWPSHYRGMPNYAPINYELDLSERPIGSTPMISFILATTFTGCSLMSVR